MRVFSKVNKRLPLVVLAMFALVGQSLYGVIGSQIANAAETIVVRQANLNGWNQVGSGGSFSDEQAKIGEGSYKLTAGTQGQKHIAYNGYSGTRLVDITELSYSSYIDTRTGNAVAPLVRIDTRLPGRNIFNQPTQVNTTLIWEPANGPQSNTGQWEDFNPLTQGKWWASPKVDFLPNTAIPAEMKTWNQIVTEYPNATVRSGNGVHLSAGQNSAGDPWTNFVGYVDNFRFNGTTYDFEPAAPVPPASPLNLASTAQNDDDITNGSTNVNFVRNSWTAAPNAVSYNYEFQKPAGLPTYSTNTTNTFVQGQFHNASSPEGQYAFRVQSVAANGLTSGWSAWSGVAYDTSAPALSNINLLVNDADTNLAKPGDTLKIVADVEDPSGIDKVQVWVRDWPYTERQITAGNMTHVAGNTYEFSFVLPTTYSNGNPINETVDGNYFNFRPYDNLGHSSIGWRNNFTVDNTNPTITVKDGYVGNLSEKTFSNVSFSLFDEHQVDKYVINGHTSDFTNNKWSDANFQNIKNHLNEGLNTFTLYDLAGNTTTYEFTYDTIAPDAPILGVTGLNSGDATNQYSIVANWNKPSSDTVKYQYQYWNDIPGNPHKASSPWQTDVNGEVRAGDFTEGEGTHYLRVRAIDATGNISDWSNVFEVTYDNTAPVLTINPLLVTVESPEISGTVNDPDATVTVEVDGIEYPATNNGDGTWTLPAGTIADLTEGDHTVVVTAKDAAGNITTLGTTLSYVAPAKPDSTQPQGSQGGGNTGGGQFIQGADNPQIAALAVDNQGGDGGNVQGTGDEDNNEEVQSEEAAVSGSTEDEDGQVASDNKFSFSWWWLLILAGIGLVLYGLWRRRNAEQ